ncbi:MAG: FHA domain-containing protein [Deltaproteobacteria bacterium]|nr:FHA domain-containing protein [Deltaproteobacteria bacterium]
MPDKLSDQETTHRINESLLTEATKIKQERSLLEERIRKLEATKSGVSESVYRRVQSDYLKKIDQYSQKFQELRKDLDAEIIVLAEKKLKLTENLNLHKEKIEEAKLRHELGEFTKEEYQKVANEGGQEVKRLEGALDLLNKSLTRFEGVLKGEEWTEKASRPVVAQKPAPPPPPPPAASPPPASKATTAPSRPQPVPIVEAVTGSTHDETVKQSPMETTSKIPIDATPPSVPKLVIVDNGHSGQAINVDHQITIGRSPANDIVLKEAKVSRQHAQVQILGNKYVLLDLESSNGTFVGGKKITEHVLQPNDEIRIGKTSLVFKV